MKWKGREGSRNVEDRRGGPGPKAAVGGIGLILALVAAFASGDLSKLLPALLQAGGTLGSAQGAERPVDPRFDDVKERLSVVLRDTEVVWGDLFQRAGNSYREPTLVLFSDAVQSGCGFQSAQVGPFYCPADQKVYLDMTFFDEMAQKLRAAGDFAQAYVVAHEVGHHVQNLLGYSAKVESARGRVSESEQNQLSVRLELQADFLAGVWAHHAEARFAMLDPDDIDEALNAANQIGDDTLQKRATGRVMPESFTHGTSAQRVRWFRRGFESGDFAGQRALFELSYDEL